MKVNLLYAFLHLIGKFILWALFRLEKIGIENIPREGGIIFAANHASFLDPILVGVASPRQMYFLAKTELFKGFFFPLFIKNLNALPMKRERVSTYTFRRLNELLGEGKAILLFPEGTRSRDGKIKKGKPGVALISYSTSSPVIPTLIEGNFEALPPGAKMLSPVKIKVKFGKPLYPQGKGNRENYREFTRIIMEEIRKLKTRGKYS